MSTTALVFWRRTENGLPATGEEVVVLIRGYGRALAFRDGQAWLFRHSERIACSRTSHVTHWHGLPDTP